jgi:hypothetical protein
MFWATSLTTIAFLHVNQSLALFNQYVETGIADPAVFEQDADFAFEHRPDSDHATAKGSDPDPT